MVPRHATFIVREREREREGGKGRGKRIFLLSFSYISCPCLFIFHQIICSLPFLVWQEIIYSIVSISRDFLLPSLRRKKKISWKPTKARRGSRTLAKSFMENSKFFINVSALGRGKFRWSTRRRGAYFIYYFARQGGWWPPRGGCRYVHTTTMSRTNERTSPPAAVCATLFHATPCGPPLPLEQRTPCSASPHQAPPALIF